MRSSISWSYSIEAIAKLLRKNNLIVRHTQNDLSAVTNLGYPRFHIKIWRKKENKITVDVHQDIAPHRGRNNQQSRKLLSKILTQLRSIQSNSRKRREIYRLSWGNKSEKDAEGGIALAAANKLVFYLRNIIFTYLVICAVHGIINELISITVIINLSVKVFFSLCICIYAFFVFLDFLGSSLLFTRMAEKYNNKDYLIILASWDHLWHEIEHIRRNHLKYTPYTILDKVLFEIKEIYRYTRKNRVKENDISLDDFPEFDIEVIKPGVIF